MNANTNSHIDTYKADVGTEKRIESEKCDKTDLSNHFHCSPTIEDGPAKRLTWVAACNTVGSSPYQRNQLRFIYLLTFENHIHDG